MRTRTVVSSWQPLTAMQAFLEPEIEIVIEPEYDMDIEIDAEREPTPVAGTRVEPPDSDAPELAVETMAASMMEHGEDWGSGEADGYFVDDEGVPAVQCNETVRMQILDSGVPSVTIGGVDVPLFGGAMGQFVWSLFSLVLCVLTVLLVGIALIVAFLRKRGWVLMAVLGAVGVLSVVLFAIVQDVGKLMVVFDWWSVGHLVLFGAGVALVVRGERRVGAR